MTDFEVNCKECGHDHIEDEEGGACMDYDCECEIDIRTVLGYKCNKCEVLTTWRDEIIDGGYICDNCWTTEILQKPCPVCKKKADYSGNSMTRCDKHTNILSLDIFHEGYSGDLDMKHILIDKDTTVGYLKNIICTDLNWSIERTTLRMYGGDQNPVFEQDKLISEYIIYDFQRLELVVNKKVCETYGCGIELDRYSLTHCYWCQDHQIKLEFRYKEKNGELKRNTN